MIDEGKKAWLQWFLDFIYLDEGRLTAGDRAKWTIDVVSMLTGYFRGGVEGTARMMPEDITTLRQSASSIWNEALNLKRFRGHLKKFFENMMGAYQRGDPGTLAEIKKVILNVEVVRGRVALTTTGSRHEDSLLFHFAQALDGIPLSVFRQCPECQRWFLHTTKRKRDFCSNRCAARKVSRSRREKLKKTSPKAYKKDLKAGRERARKSYEKRLKKRLPGAKPARRPRQQKGMN